MKVGDDVGTAQVPRQYGRERGVEFHLSDDCWERIAAVLFEPALNDEFGIVEVGKCEY